MSTIIRDKYPATLIADYLIQKAKSKDCYLTPLKLIKLVYFAYGWCLSITSYQLINEPIEAWQYGPVVPSLYQKFKHYGNKEITDYAPRNDILNKFIMGNSQIVALLNRILEVYGDYTATQLSNMTHETGTPWAITWNSNREKYFNNKVINDSLIKEYFDRLLLADGHRQGYNQP